MGGITSSMEAAPEVAAMTEVTSVLAMARPERRAGVKEVTLP